MAGLTVLAASGFRWQYSRYQDAVPRFANLKQSLRSGIPLLFDQQLAAKGQPYIDGLFVQLPEFRLQGTVKFVYRQNQQRDGYKVVWLAALQNGSFVLVDEGWIPTSLKGQFSTYIPSGVRQGVLRKSESSNEEIQRERLKAGLQLSTIDVKILGEVFGQKVQECYLQRVTESEQLYPFSHSLSTLPEPYLTPEKHLTYAAFWGCCTGVGLLTLRRLL